MAKPLFLLRAFTQVHLPDWSLFVPSCLKAPIPKKDKAEKNTTKPFQPLSMKSISGSVMSDSLPPNIAFQAPRSIEFFSQKYWSGLLFPFSGDLEPGSFALQADSLPSEPPGKHKNYNTLKDEIKFSVHLKKLKYLTEE